METKQHEYVQALSAPGERCWVNWKFEEREGKKTKVPYTPNNTRASSTNPATWSTHDEVVAVAENFDGIGIVFTGSLLGIDLDHVISEDGTITAEIATLIEKAKTYTEVSPSKTGLHLYLRLTEPLLLERNRSGSYECYTTGRFFTVTGIPWDASCPIRSVDSVEAIEILREMGYPWGKEDSVVVLDEEAPPNGEYEEDPLFRNMFTSKHGKKIYDLYHGDTSEYDGDESRADAALCAYLAFWTGGDTRRIESEWLQSPLGAREKTQNRPDYRKRTIQNAMELLSGESTVSPPSVQKRKLDKESTQNKKARYTFFKDIKSKPVEWLWPGRIARGKVTIVCGDPGLGKSLFTVTLAAIVSRGFPWPVDGGHAPVGDTIIVSAEDAADDTIGPRLEAAEADVNRVAILEAIVKTNPDGTNGERMFSLKEDLEELASVLSEMPDPALVIIDPISAYLSGADSHNNAEMRSLLAPLAALATRFNVAIVVVSHLNKNNNNTNALHRVMGSMAFVAAARAGYAVVRDKENPERRLVLPVKNNLASDLTGVAYSIMNTGNNVPVIAWEKDAVIVPKDEILSGPASSEKRTETDKAKELLVWELTDGPKTAEHMLQAGEKEGFSYKTMRLAREQLGVEPEKEKGVVNGSWLWELPENKSVQKVENAPESEEDEGPW